MRLMYLSGVWSYVVGAISTPLFILVPILTIWSVFSPSVFHYHLHSINFHELECVVVVKPKWGNTRNKTEHWNNFLHEARYQYKFNRENMWNYMVCLDLFFQAFHDVKYTTYNSLDVLCENTILQNAQCSLCLKQLQVSQYFPVRRFGIFPIIINFWVALALTIYTVVSLCFTQFSVIITSEVSSMLSSYNLLILKPLILLSSWNFKNNLEHPLSNSTNAIWLQIKVWICAFQGKYLYCRILPIS